MKLTKHAHATVSLTKNGRTVVLDPGTFTSDSVQLMATAEAVLVTHDHFDHFDPAAVTAALGGHPRLVVYGPPPVRDQLAEHGDRVVTVTAGDSFVVAGFTVAVFGERHAPIHADLPEVHNVGYLVDGLLFDPGDAYLVPGVPVDTLLLPTSGPWTQTGEAVDYVRAVAPRRSIQIHDVMLSPVGRQSAAMFLGEQGLTGVPLLTLDVGGSTEL